MDLLMAIGSARSVATFVKIWRPASTLADLSLTAAKDILSEITYT
jgi:hypothetical protein